MKTEEARYQIKVVDNDLCGILKQLTGEGFKIVDKIAGEGKTNLVLYQNVFNACTNSLKKYVKAFDFCGTQTLCDEGISPTYMMKKHPEARQKAVIPTTSDKIKRYAIIGMDIPLEKFVNRLEAAIVNAVCKTVEHKKWHGLAGEVREAIERVLGRCLYSSTSCGLTDLCQRGAKEYDPWIYKPSNRANEKK